ncbi:FkbM family methyltransferase [Caenimonas sp. SL110]|uniref:FkbM family methyltransferase n=1 Tax=Caenimonas sp. SL110 TaxID=1450524 RepID=UPI00069EFD6E|nr:FkbM family methyltransferase [Caenimonas sp. SL110]
MQSPSVLARKLVRLPLKLVPALRPMPVLSGPLAGKRWLSTSGTHGCWLGIYESELQRLLVDSLSAGDVFLDVGANVGFFSLLGATLVGPAGKVVAFEPVSENAQLLLRNLALNKVSNVQLIEAAVADRVGTASFEDGQSPSQGRLGTGGRSVPVVTLDGLLASGAIPVPQVIKMDIEGAESLALAGARGLLSAHRPKLLLSTHGYQQQAQCLEFLHALGYSTVLRRDGRTDGQYEVVAT